MTESAARGPASNAGSTLRWPPPGLERMQGDLGQIAARAGLAGGLLVLPLLFVVARQQGFATLGPFADAWWVTIILATVGLAFSIDTIVRTARMLLRASQAIGRGYDLATVAHVVADGGRDMGFLLQGARHFVVMDERERSAIVHIRIFAVSLYVLAGLWLSLSLGVGLLAAARGLLTPSTLWMGTLLPAAMAYAFGTVGRVVHESRERRARKAYHNQPWSADLASEEIAAWRSGRAALEVGVPAAEAEITSPALVPALRRIGFGVGLVGFVVALPVMTLMPTSIVAPVLTMVVTPQFDRARQQAARVEGLRPYVVDADASITPQEAGQLLHDMAYVGSDQEPVGGEREPSRRVAQAWLPDVAGETNPLGVEPFAWADSLLEVVARGTTGEQRAYLADVASHPSSADFSRLARARDLDAASARWVTPLPVGTTVATMPIPRFGGLRAAAQVHIGAAAYELTQSRPERAEALLSEVISVGFLLDDYGPTLIDNLIGFSFVESGGRALEDLYAVTGRTAALGELVRLREAADRAASRVRVGGSQGSETWVRSLPDMVFDTSAVRGLRWEYFIGVATLAPCLNLHRIVFGPDEDYRAFIEGAHDSLVRWPSEEGLFAMAKAGWLGTSESDRETWIGRILSVSMRRGDGACGDVVRNAETARALF